MDPMTAQQASEQAAFNYNLLNCVASLSAVGASIAAVIRTFRRQPALSEEVYKTFATKDDLKELKHHIDDVKTEIDRKLASGDKCFKDMERVIGKLEGFLSRCPFMCGQVAPGVGRHPV